MLVPSFIKDKNLYERRFKPISVLITIFSVCYAMLFFRAENVETGYEMSRSLLGLNGISIPEGIFVHLGPLKNLLHTFGVTADSTAGSLVTYGSIYCITYLCIALFLPNSLDIVRNNNPALGFSTKRYKPNDLMFNNYLSKVFIWRPSRLWAVIIGIAIALGIMSLQRISVFLYWQF